METTVATYKNFQPEIIGHLIEVSGFRNDFLAGKMSIDMADFNRKISQQFWTDSELERLLSVLTEPNEELQDLLMLEVMRGRRDEPEMSYADFKKETASWS